MNIRVLARLLEELGVSPQSLSIGAEADNAWCLIPSEIETETGEPTWEVFWREQGNRYDWACFSNEQVACYYLYGRLAWSQVLLGQVGKLRPESSN
jgi:hypothetical protein